LLVSNIDELENQNESEITQPELDEQNTILKETSSNNNRCTDAIQTHSQNILNENNFVSLFRSSLHLADMDSSS
jgi:hypothetical protein